MLSFPPVVHIWLATAAVDLRKSFDTLAELVRQHLQHDPLSTSFRTGGVLLGEHIVVA